MSMAELDNIRGSSLVSQRSPTDRISLSHRVANSGADCLPRHSRRTYRDAAVLGVSTCKTLTFVYDRIIDILVSVNGSEHSK